MLRLKEIITEEEEIKDFDELTGFIDKNCQSFLKQIDYDFKKYQLYRGITYPPQFAATYQTNMNRTPANTPLQLHKIYIEAFRNAGFVANRNNSVFCSGSRSQAASYGSVANLIPIGDFEITWSPEIKDLYGLKNINNFFDNGILEFDPTKFPIQKLQKASDYNILEFLRYFEKEHEKRLTLVELFRKNKFDNMSVKDFYDSKYNTLKLPYDTFIKKVGAFLNVQFENDIHFIDIGLSKWITENYKDTNLKDAILSGNEVMVHCKEYLLINDIAFKAFARIKYEGK